MTSISFKAIFFLALNDTSTKVRQRICYAFAALVDGRYSQIEISISNIVQYMIMLTSDSNLNVALAACEFWNVIAEAEYCKTAVGPFLPQYVQDNCSIAAPLSYHSTRLVHILLQSMRYSPAELVSLGADGPDTNAHIPDTDQEIKPILLKGRRRVSSDDDECTSG